MVTFKELALTSSIDQFSPQAQLLTDRPFVIIPGERSLFSRPKFWDELCELLLQEGYQVSLARSPWRKNARVDYLKELFSSEECLRGSHFFLELSDFLALELTSPNSFPCGSLTLLGIEGASQLKTKVPLIQNASLKANILQLTPSKSQLRRIQGLRGLHSSVLPLRPQASPFLGFQMEAHNKRAIFSRAHKLAEADFIQGSQK